MCSVEGCDRDVRARGLCDKHYRRFAKHGDPNVSLLNRENDGRCSIDGCARPYYARGLCEMHYARTRKRGSTGGPRPERADADGFMFERLPDGREGKVCARCGELKAVSNYSPRATASGLHSECRACSRRRQRDFIAANREKYLATQAAKRAANPDRYRGYSVKRRTVERSNAVYVVADRDLRRLYASPCAACGSRDVIHADHIIPVSRGGRYSIGNLQPLCQSCNRSKGNRLLVEWRLGDR